MRDRFKGFNDFDVKIGFDDPVFVISVVSKICSIPVWTLRELEKKGIVRPQRIGKKTRCYSKHQIQTLEYAHYLMEQKHVNISGIKVILDMRR